MHHSNENKLLNWTGVEGLGVRGWELGLSTYLLVQPMTPIISRKIDQNRNLKTLGNHGHDSGLQFSILANITRLGIAGSVGARKYKFQLQFGLMKGLPQITHYS